MREQRGSGFHLAAVLAFAIPLPTLAASASCGRGRQGDDGPDAVSGRVALKVGSLDREYFVHVPKSLDRSKPAPLVFVLHGGEHSAQGMRDLTGFDRVAETEGFLAVYPSAYEGHWNDGRKIDAWEAHEKGIDDVGFLRAIVQDLSPRFSIDASRIYAAGLSNGGLMCYRLALECSDLFAAVAAVAANLPRDLQDVKGGGPVSVLIVSGTADKVMPYGGGVVKAGRKKAGEVLSAEETAAFWSQRQGCKGEAVRTRLPDRDPEDGTTVSRTDYGKGNGGAAVVLHSVQEGGHAWPGRPMKRLGERLFGPTSLDIDATQLIWEFFEGHARKENP